MGWMPTNCKIWPQNSSRQRADSPNTKDHSECVQGVIVTGPLAR